MKFTFAAALISWLIISDNLDLSLVKKSFKIGPQWLIAFIIIFVQTSLAAFRYKLLLETKSQKPLPFLNVLKINYIGQFFSTVLPGAVTGDLLKLFYVRKLDENFSKTFLLTTTLIDRILGLSALLFLAVFFSLLYYLEITTLSSKINGIIILNLLLFSCALIFLGFLLSPHNFQTAIINIIKKIPFLGIKMSVIVDQLFSFREKKQKLMFSFFLSIVIQFFSILSFWIITAPFFSRHLPLQYAFSFIPVGLIANAIPISPGGLGVGHVLFANLFSFVNMTNGASLFNLYFLCNFTHNFLGIIPFLMAGKIKDLNKLKGFR